jgi:hypothetical protein
LGQWIFLQLFVRSWLGIALNIQYVPQWSVFGTRGMEKNHDPAGQSWLVETVCPAERPRVTVFGENLRNLYISAVVPEAFRCGMQRHFEMAFRRVTHHLC